jgi:hypothetical protein
MAQCVDGVTGRLARLTIHVQRAEPAGTDEDETR